MEKISLSITRPRARVDHPGNDLVKPGQIWIEIEKPRRVDFELQHVEMGKYDDFQPVINAKTGRPFQDATGAAIMGKHPKRVPPGVLLEFLAKFVTFIGGTNEEFAPARAYQMLEALSEEEFDYKTKKQVPVLGDDGVDTGTTEEKEVEMPFPLLVWEKIQEKETFTGPLGIRSSDSSSAGSGTVGNSADAVS